jgi:transposase
VPKSNRRWKPCFSKGFYRERNLIERFFSRLKHFRRVARRHDPFSSREPISTLLENAL